MRIDSRTPSSSSTARTRLRFSGILPSFRARQSDAHLQLIVIALDPTRAAVSSDQCFRHHQVQRPGSVAVALVVERAGELLLDAACRARMEDELSLRREL